MTERKLIGRKGLLALAALLLLCGAVFLLFSRLPAGTEAVVELDGKELLRQKLTELSGPVEREIEGDNGIRLTVVFEPDGAAIRASACPDGICVRMGKLTRAGESAICLPARIVLRLTGAEEGPDAATG